MKKLSNAASLMVRVFMPKATVRRLDERAAHLGESRSAVIREAVRRYLGEPENESGPR